MTTSSTTSMPTSSSVTAPVVPGRTSCTSVVISGARSIVETVKDQVNAHDTAAVIEDQGYDGCWVLALGTTDTANVAVGGGGRLGRAERIDAMMEVVGDDPVMWVNVTTLETDGPWADEQMEAWDDELVRATRRYSNLRVFDWAASAREPWFADDLIHYRSVGSAQRARLIADALAIALPA